MLTNYREPITVNVQGLKSRGAMVTAWLQQPISSTKSTKEFAEELIISETAGQVGGFSLICGKVGEPLAVVGNRMTATEHIDWIASEPNQTVGLSNTTYGSEKWPKVEKGEALLAETLAKSCAVKEAEEQLIERLFNVLSVDTLPRWQAGDGDDGQMEAHIHDLRHSIYIPVLGRPGGLNPQTTTPSGTSTPQSIPEKPDAIAAAAAPSKVTVLDPPAQHVTAQAPPDYMHGAYGTQKQTVVLVDREGRVKYIERTLFEGEDVRAVKRGEGDVVFEFVVER